MTMKRAKGKAKTSAGRQASAGRRAGRKASAGRQAGRKASARVSNRASGRASFSQSSEPLLDGKGRVLKGRKIDIEATEEYYSSYYAPTRERIYFNSDKEFNKARRKTLLNFVDFFNSQTQSGRVPIKRGKASEQLATRFGAITPEGSKAVFLPKKFAGKRISIKGGIPILKTKTTETRVYFIDFITPEFEQEIEDALDNFAETEELLELIEKYVRPFVDKLPKGAMYSVTLATGDYAKGSTFDKESLIEFLTDLILRFIKSKGVGELKDFAVAVNAVFVKRPKRSPKKKRRK